MVKFAGNNTPTKCQGGRSATYGTSRRQATDKSFIVETATSTIERCMLMATDPGDLVLDPTCGSGTTAFVAEKWGRRWITIDINSIQISLCRQRIITAINDWYLTRDSHEGRRKEARLAGTEQPAGTDAARSALRPR